MDPLEQLRAALAKAQEEAEVKRAALIEFDREGLTKEDITRMDTVTTEFTAADEAVKAAQAAVDDQVKRNEMLARARGTQYSLEKATINVGGKETSKSETDVMRSVFEGTASKGDLTSRALNLLDKAEDDVPDASKAKVEKILRKNDRHGRIAKHMVAYGSGAYEKAFEAAIEARGNMNVVDDDDRNVLRMAEQIRRQMQIDTGSAQGGSFMLPTLLDPTLMLTNDGTVNPLRAISDVKSISQNVWNGVSTAGVDADWYAESAQTGDHNPVVAPRSVTAHAARAWVFASYEFNQDSNFASQLGMLFSDAKDRLESTAFQVGTGIGEPEGVVTGVAAVPASVITDGGTYDVENVYELTGQLPPRHSPQGSYIANKRTILDTRQFGTANVFHAFWADLGAGNPAQLLGQPIREASEMDDSTDAGGNYLLYGNFSRYMIVDRIGASVQFEPTIMRPRADDAAQLAPSGESGWFLFWRVGAAVQDANAFRLLQQGV